MAGIHRQSTISAHARREDRIARIAGAQHGLLTLAQLRGTGLSDGGIRHRVHSGRLHRVHRGVFSLGRPPARPVEHRMAAVLACGRDAALSHAAAAAHLGIRPSAATVIDVTNPRGTGRRQEGLRAHRSALAQAEIALVDRIPTTTCARTLLDLADVVDGSTLARAIDQAEILRLFDLTDLQRVLANNPGRHGLSSLRAQLTSLDPSSKLTRSELERRLLQLVAESDMPRPEVNATLFLEGRVVEVDFLWRREHLVVETDGWETHRTRQAFERDRAKDALLARAGYRVVRFTWRQLAREPDLVRATLTAARAA